MAVVEKRPLDENVFSCKHIVLDIEGTTTSINFVKDTLFPYIKKNLHEYFTSHWEEEEFKSVLDLLKNQAAEDKKADVDGAVEIPSEGATEDQRSAAIENVLWQMGADRKTTALKKLQGHMWRQGYKSGELKGHLFADVAPAMRDWVKDGRKLYVYSSGSVEAQKLLFGHTIEGDLTELFTDFFDTEVGAKVDVNSYKAILKKLDSSADDVLFLTDMPKEASAARLAGLPVVLVEREGNEPVVGDLRKEFSAVSSFEELLFDQSSKKPKLVGDGLNENSKENGHCDVKVNGNTDSKDSEPMDVDMTEETSITEKEPESARKPVSEEEMKVDEESDKPPEEKACNETVEDKSEDSENKSTVSKTSEDKCQTTTKKEVQPAQTTNDKDEEASKNAVEAKNETKSDLLESDQKTNVSKEDASKDIDTALALPDKASSEKGDVPVTENAKVVPEEKNHIDDSLQQDVTNEVSEIKNKISTEEKNPNMTEEASNVKTEEECKIKETAIDTKSCNDAMDSIAASESAEQEMGKVSDKPERSIKDPVSSDKTANNVESKTEDGVKKGEENSNQTEKDKKQTENDVEQTEEVEKTEIDVKKTEDDGKKTEEDIKQTVDTKQTEEKVVAEDFIKSKDETTVDSKSVAKSTIEEEKGTGPTEDDSGISNKDLNGEHKENGGTNGSLENGHEAILKEDIPNVTSKNTSNSQVDAPVSDTEVAVEA